MKTLIVDEEISDIRIDKYLIDILNISRNRIQRLIENEKIMVNSKKIKNSYVVRVDDVIKIEEEFIEENNDVVPEPMDLDIVYEDKYLLVINKPSGMVVHPAPGHYHNTLVNGLLYHTKLSNNDVRPGIVHRIDKDTSGLLLVAKDDNVHALLSDDIANKRVKREYIALVNGVIRNETGTIDAPIGRDLIDRKKMAVTDVNSKDAITHFRVIERYKNTTLIECILDTGRTHQIRVHMSYIGFPIVNDPIYGKNRDDKEFGQMLHAKKLTFIHPITKENMEFSCNPPLEFERILENYKKES